MKRVTLLVAAVIVLLVGTGGGTGLTAAFGESPESAVLESLPISLSAVTGEAIGEGAEFLFQVVTLRDLVVLQDEHLGLDPFHARSVNLNDADLAAISGRGVPHYGGPTKHLGVVLWDERPGSSGVVSYNSSTGLGANQVSTITTVSGQAR
jgi:hypothetical protein